MTTGSFDEGGEDALKKWKCVEVGHHRRIAETIESHQRDGWLLHSHAAAGNPGAISHYLLFEREG